MNNYDRKLVLLDESVQFINSLTDSDLFFGGGGDFSPCSAFRGVSGRAPSLSCELP